MSESCRWRLQRKVCVVVYLKCLAYADWASNRATAGEMVQIFRILLKEIQNSLHRQSWDWDCGHLGNPDIHQTINGSKFDKQPKNLRSSHLKNIHLETMNFQESHIHPFQMSKQHRRQVVHLKPGLIGGKCVFSEHRRKLLRWYLNSNWWRQHWPPVQMPPR